jgi:hypothetical protein
MKSKYFSLNLKDFFKSIQVAITTSIIPSVMVIIEQGRLPLLNELKEIGFVGLAAWLGYLLKNFFTNSKDEFLTNEQPNNN